jgi:hypothetical protein
MGKLDELNTNRYVLVVYFREVWKKGRMKTKAAYVNLWQQKRMSSFNNHVNAKVTTTQPENLRWRIKLELAFLARRCEIVAYVNDSRACLITHIITACLKTCNSTTADLFNKQRSIPQQLTVIFFIKKLPHTEPPKEMCNRHHKIRHWTLAYILHACYMFRP